LITLWNAKSWIAGGAPVNHHNLADFRVDHVAVLVGPGATLK
jgi:hypothetical protein